MQFLQPPPPSAANRRPTPGNAIDLALQERARHALVLRDEVIAWVGPADELGISNDVRRLPAAGTFVVPGFIDMHAHIAFGPVEMRMENGTPISATHGASVT